MDTMAWQRFCVGRTRQFVPIVVFSCRSQNMASGMHFYRMVRSICGSHSIVQGPEHQDRVPLASEAMKARAMVHSTRRKSQSRPIVADSVWAKSRMSYGECLWQQDSVWRSMVDELEQFPSPIKVLELCGGMSSASLAVNALLGQRKLELVGFYDVDDDLKSAMDSLHGRDHPCVHLGASGDILRLAPDAFPPCHGLVAGPPCPPWSALGKRNSFEDPRAAVFWRVVDVIIFAGQHSKLLFFILENVPGLLKRNNGSAEPPVKVIVRALEEALASFVVEVICVNTLDFGLPQSRPRVYIVGRRQSAFPRGQPPPVRPFAGRSPMSSILERTASAPPKHYTPTQTQNIADFKVKYAAWMTDPGQKGKYMVVDTSRTPSDRTVWGSAAHEPDISECLTASGPSLHVFALGEGSGTLSVDRPLSARERGSLQGFPASVLSVLSQLPERFVRRATGNAMSIPVVGSVMGRMLLALQRSHEGPALRALLDLDFHPPFPHVATCGPAPKTPESKKDTLSVQLKNAARIHNQHFFCSVVQTQSALRSQEAAP